MNVENILCLVDFSESSDHVVASAGHQAALNEAKVWVVHIASPDPDFVGYEVGPQYIRDARASELTSEHEKLQAYREKLTSAGVQAEALLIQGPVKATIEQEIDKLNIDLVILGSHGHTRLYELMVGSVAEIVLRNVTVPVLVLPGKK